MLNVCARCLPSLALEPEVNSRMRERTETQRTWAIQEPKQARAGVSDWGWESTRRILIGRLVIGVPWRPSLSGFFACVCTVRGLRLGAGKVPSAVPSPSLNRG